MFTPRCFCHLLIFAICWQSTMELSSAHAAQKSAKPTIKKRISQSAIGARSTIPWSAQELGLFAKHGIDAEVVYLRMMSTLNAKANRARIEEIIDNRIVRKLDESGFIDSLYVKN